MRWSLIGVTLEKLWALLRSFVGQCCGVLEHVHAQVAMLIS